MRLFCFPHAGGSAAAFRDWAGLLHDDVDLCCMQPPGRASRFLETPFRSLLPMADAAAAAIAPWLDRPHALFGHSLGARLAFETARAQQRHELPVPRALFLSGSRAPHSPQRQPLHALPDADLLRELQKLGGLPQEVLDAPEMLAMLLPLIRADLEAYETYTYVPGSPLKAPIHVLSGADDDSVPLSCIEAWRIYGSAGFELSVFPGGHFYLETERERVVSEVVRRLLTTSAEALMRGRASQSSSAGARSSPR